MRMRHGLLLVLLLILGGCSSGTRLAYNHLDRLVAWQLSDYVTLDAAQNSEFDRSFQSLWDWHRATQLPRYATDLREMAATVARGTPDTESVAAALAKIERHGDVLGQKIGAALGTLIPMLDDAQVAGLIARQRKDIDREERKLAAESPEARHQRYRKKIADFFDDWIGDLNESQKAIVERAWTTGFATLPTVAQRYQWRLEDLRRLEALLAQRRSADFAERLRQFGDDDPQRAESEQGRSDAAARVRQRQLTLDVLTRLDAAQRRRLTTRLIELAEDCEALAAKARPASEASTQP